MMIRIAAIIACLLIPGLAHRRSSNTGGWWVPQSKPGEVVVRVTESATHRMIPCRVTVVDSTGELADLTCEKSVTIASRRGVIYTATGEARFKVAPGNYTIYAGHGAEYSLATRPLEVSNKPIDLNLELTHEVDMQNFISCDTHIHTLTYSGHGDCTIDERLVTLAAEDIEMPVSTEHNVHTDYAPAAKRTGVERYLTPVIGNEVTTPQGHFNIFPVKPGSAPPDPTVTDWSKLIPALRSVPGVRVVVLNHPENIHTGFKDADPKRFHAASGEALDGRPWDVDAIEVLNSSAHQSDMMKPFRDWFALLNRGKHIVAVGSSDCHDVNKYIVGQSRTYILASRSPIPSGVQPPDHEPVDVERACRNLLNGEALVSMGLVTEVLLDGKYLPGEIAPTSGNHIAVRARVRGPKWIAADRLEVYGNGQLLLSQPILSDPQKVIKLDETFRLPKLRHDMWLVAIASGPGIREPYWPISRPYQPTRPDWEPRVIGATNPIFIDADGDGKYTSPFEYAKRIVEEANGSIDRVLAACEKYDEAVAVQCASRLRGKGVDLKAAMGRIDESAPQVRQGFLAYVNILP